MALSPSLSQNYALRQPAEKSPFIMPFKPPPTQIHRRDQ
jgi:hypothetical protein